MFVVTYIFIPESQIMASVEVPELQDRLQLTALQENERRRAEKSKIRQRVKAPGDEYQL